MEILKNYINGQWVDSKEKRTIDVLNPANQEVLARVPFGKETVADVNKAVNAAAKALREWRHVPVMQRVQPLYKLKTLLEEHKEDVARLITLECGKSFAESVAEMQRGIENVETACATPTLMQSEFSENIASGIDEFMIRQPLGVTTIIACAESGSSVSRIITPALAQLFVFSMLWTLAVIEPGPDSVL